MLKTLTLALILAVSIMAQAQISFVPASEGYTKGFRSGVAVMVTDANGDGRDDIIRMDQGNKVTVTLQGQSGRFLNSFSYQLNGSEQWNITGGDLDNDGGLDILTSGVYDRVKVFRSQPFSYDYTYETVGSNNFFGQACNTVDINNDGYLDHFVCHDDGKSVIFMNDSTGNLIRNDTIIDFTTTPPSDNSGNYGSIWTDIDSDGDLDLYIAKCRGGVNDPTDPRRINALYLNDGNGKYTEVADSFNLAIGAQSWTADFGDIDNDGDFDIFITNHNVPGQLMENIDNAYFEDITLAAGLDVSGLSMQGTFRDFDNDGWMDLVVSGPNNYLYRNLGTRTFELVASPFSEKSITSYGIGDLNSDGYLDLYATYNELYNDPSSVDDDVIWLNTGTGNNHVKVLLTGTQCNRSAVGSRLYLFGEWGMQTREVHAGEGYGITNSLIQHFGIGTSEKIDSLVIIWPNGGREVFAGVEVNRTACITEGACMTYLLDLNDGPFVQCVDEEFVLSAPDGYAAYLWSNGDTTQQLTIDTAGIYHVSLTDSTGCLWVAGSVIISPVSDVEPDEIILSLDGRLKACSDESPILSVPEGGLDYLWSTGEAGTSISADVSGTYFVEVRYTCKTLVSDTISVDVVDPNDIEVQNDTILGAGAAALVAIGDSVLWYDDAAGPPVHEGPLYVTPVIDTTTTFYAQNIKVISGGTASVGPAGHSGNTMYNSIMSNGAIRFNVEERFRLDSVHVFTTFPGERTVLILDSDSDTIFQQTYQIDSGDMYLPINHWLEPGEAYRMTTNSDRNQVTFGGNSPRLVRSDGGVTYPYDVQGVVQLIGSSASLQFFYYFYDWHLTLEDKYCVGDLVPVLAVVVDTTSGTRELRPEALSLMPNPATDEITGVSADILTQVQHLHVLDAQGRIAAGWQFDKATGRILIGALPQGLYLVRAELDDRTLIGRFLKM